VPFNFRGDSEENMRWVRLWTDETLRGSTFDELDLEMRGLWFSLLVMAGHSVIPGKICVSEKVALTKQQIAATLKITVDELNAGLKHLKTPEIDKVVEKDGFIFIKNWRKYQTEYERQKPYRKKQKEKETSLPLNDK
jgi:hypothetical protein